MDLTLRCKNCKHFIKDGKKYSNGGCCALNYNAVVTESFWCKRWAAKQKEVS